MFHPIVGYMHAIESQLDLHTSECIMDVSKRIPALKVVPVNLELSLSAFLSHWYNLVVDDLFTRELSGRWLITLVVGALNDAEMKK